MEIKQHAILILNIKGSKKLTVTWAESVCSPILEATILLKNCLILSFWRFSQILMLNIIFSPLEHNKLEASLEKQSYISHFPESPHFWATAEEQHPSFLPPFFYVWSWHEEYPTWRVPHVSSPCTQYLCSCFSAWGKQICAILPLKI